MKPGTLKRAAGAALCLAHAPAALAHAGHGAPMIHAHGAETLAILAAAILAGAAASWAATRREARARR